MVTAIETAIVATTEDVPARQTIEAIDEVKETPTPILQAETIVIESARTDTLVVTDEVTVEIVANAQNVGSVQREATARTVENAQREANVNGTAIEALLDEMRVATTTSDQIGETETLMKTVDEEEEIAGKMHSQHARRTDAVQALRPRSESLRPT